MYNTTHSQKNTQKIVQSLFRGVTVVMGVLSLFSFFPPSTAHAATTVTYSAVTSGTSFVVPDGVTSITVKAWGGGGGGGRGAASNGTGGAGGGGGFSQSTITVTPGESLTVRVGGGGVSGTATAQTPGAGGGYSGVFRSSTPLIMAGAGGGGGSGAGTAAFNGGAGGGGGGTTGANGAAAPSAGNGGSGGTQSAGGAGGTGTAATDGESGEVDGRYEGGDGLGVAGPAGGTNGGGDASTALGAGGSAGGAGYYGGGGSESAVADTRGTGGGGGGSNYVTGTATTSTQASGSTTPNTSDGDYVSNSGMGGAGGQTSASNGNDGLVVLTYAPATKTIFLTSGTTWQVPSDWTSEGSMIEVIGAGGAGHPASSGSAGGGGGAYSQITDISLTPGASVTYQVGVGGTAGFATGTDSLFNGIGTSCALNGGSVCAKGGAVSTSTLGGTGGAGGSSTLGIGTIKTSGGRGGDSQQGIFEMGGGGGGAGGPHGDGKNGAIGDTGKGGGGGGGADNGFAGSVGVTQTGGTGGHNRLGVGGGAGGTSTPFTLATVGTAGGGGGGGGEGAGDAGGVGADGGVGEALWTQTSNSATAGPGGGAGGNGNALTFPAGDGGLYGGGGGGGADAAPSGDGADGIIIITYIPSDVFSTFTISGTVYSDNGITPVGADVDVNLKVGDFDVTSGTTLSDGTFSIGSATATPSTPMTLFVNASSTLKATTFLMGADGVSDITGIPLYKDTVISMSTTSAGTVDMKQMTFFDMEDDGDVLYSAYGSSTLATSSPATTTIYGNFLVATGTTYAPSALAVKGDFTNNGVFKNSGGIVDISGKPYSLGGFDATTTALAHSFSVSAQESAPRGISFNDDGTKMFIIGSGGDEVNEYLLSTAFDISTAVADSLFSVVVQDTDPRGFAFNSDGTKMFVLGNSGVDVNEYLLSIPFVITTASSSNKAFSVATEEAAPRGIAFNTDGTKMFIVGNTGDEVNEYHLSTAFDIATAVPDSVFSVAAQDTDPQGIAFSTDGAKMFITGNTGDEINEYLLATPFDVSTASHYSVFSIASEDTSVSGLTVSPDGTKMYVLGTAGVDISEYHLKAPFDLAATSTARFSVSAYDITARGVAFNTDGTKMFFSGGASDDLNEFALSSAFDVTTAVFAASTSLRAANATSQGIAFKSDGTSAYVSDYFGFIYQYNLSTAWDVSTMSYVASTSVTAQVTNPCGVTFNADGTSMYVTDDTGADVNQYTLSVPWDITSKASLQAFSVNTQDADPRGLSFNTDGTKMFVVGNAGDEIDQYDLSVGWDISTAVFDRVLSITAQDTAPIDLKFNTDGTKMFVVGETGIDINEYDLPELFITGSSTISGTLTGASAFNDLRLSGDSPKTFSANAETANFSIADAGTLVSAPSALAINGNFSNNGTFAHNKGTVTLSGTSSVVSGHFVGSTTALYDTIIDTGLIFKNDGVTWSPQSATEANNWQALAYGNGTFVAVASDGTNRVMTSPDGITWTAYPAVDTGIWSDITFGEGLFVAVSELTGSTRVMTSPDGITWTGRTAADSTTWRTITYGNGMFVALSYSGANRVMTSPDGITWTLRTAAVASLTWRGITYGNGLFVAVSSAVGSNSTNIVMTSPDGVSWTAQSIPESNNGWRDITYGGGLFVAVSDSGTNRVMTSPDGISWTMRSAATASGWSGVTYGNGLFVAVATTSSNLVMTSPDGVTWTSRAQAETNQWEDIIYANGTFVAVGSSGTNRVMTSTSGTNEKDTVTFADNASTTDLTISANSAFVAPRGFTIGDDFVNNGEYRHGSGTVYFSGTDASLSGSMTGSSTFNDVVVDGGGFKNNGVSWVVASSSEQNSWYAVAYGEGLFVAVSIDGTNRVMTSPDAVTWTARSAAQANQWTSITYAEGLFVAVSYTGTNRVMTSPDGITWTVRAAADANGWESVTYGNGRFVAVSSTGAKRVMYSDDGFSWASSTAAEQNTWDCITYGNGLFVALSIDGENRVMTSPDGITWTERKAASQQQWYGVVYGDGLFVGIASSTATTSSVMTSPDGINWTLRTAPEARQWWALTYGNGLFVSASNDGTNRVMTSSDGINWTMRTATAVTQWRSMVYGAGRFVTVGNLGTNRAMYSVSGATTTAVLSFSNNASTTDFSISNTETVTAPSQFSVRGDYTNNGTFTNNSGSVTFSGNEFDTGNEFDGSSLTFVESFSSYDFNPTGLAFNADGTKMFESDITDDVVIQSSLTTPWDITTATYISSTSVSAQDTQPEGVAFNTDGTRMFVTGGVGQDINQYTLSTAWDVTTKTFNYAFSVAAQDTAPRNIAFNAEGTQMYVTGATGWDISIYNLSTPFTASTSVFSASLALNEVIPHSLAFNQDGTQMYVGGYSDSQIVVYNLSTPYDLTTAATSTAVSILVPAYQPQGLALKPDGTKLFALSNQHKAIFAFDINNQKITGNLTGTSALNNVSFSGALTKKFQNNASTSNISIGASSTVVAPTLLSVGGNYANSGIFKAGTGTTTFLGGSAQALSGTMTGTSSLYHVVFTGAGTKTFSSNASTSNFVISSSTTVVAPTRLTVGGDYTNNGTFTKGSGTTTFSGRELSLGGYNLASTTFTRSFSYAGNDSDARGLAFNPDGTRMYLLGQTNDAVMMYQLTTGFNLSTASFMSSTSISAQETAPMDIAFNNDGTKMFVFGTASDSVNQYTLSTPYDVTTRSFVTAFSVASQDGTANGLTFSPDGKKMFIIGLAVNGVAPAYEYTLSTSFDVSTAVFAQRVSIGSYLSSPRDLLFSSDGTKMFVVSSSIDKIGMYTLGMPFDISTNFFVASTSVIAAQDTEPRHIAFNADGTKLFVVGTTGDTVNEYSLAAPSDFGVTWRQSFSILAEDTSASGIAFSSDGLNMYMVGTVGQEINQYKLTNAWKTSSASFKNVFSTASQDTAPRGLAFNTDGTKMYVVGLTNDKVYTYNVSDPWNVLTAVFNSSTSVSAQDTNPIDVTFNTDGTRMYVLGNTSGGVNQYNLASGFDVSTAAFSTVFSVTPQDTNPRALAFSVDGTKMYVVGGTTLNVYQYNLSTPFSVSTAVVAAAYPVGLQDTAPRGIAFSASGDSMFVAGLTNDFVYTYRLAETFDDDTVILGNATSTSAFNNISFSGLGTTTFAVNASTTNFSIATGTHVVAPNLLSISGHYTNNGDFKANSGTTTFNGTSVQTATGTMTDGSAFYNLEFRNRTATTTLGASTTVTNNFVAVANATVVFPARATTTVATLSLDGGVGSEIKVRSSIPGTQANLNVGTQKNINYVNVRDSNACGGTTITALHTTDSGNNTCWTISGDPFMASDADQIFTLGQATTSISTITLTETAAPAILAVNDIRIAIATSTHDMKFDTFDTSAIFGGTAAGKVSGTVSYTGSGSVLIIDVLTNFSALDTLTISGLSFAQFNAIAPVARVLNLYYDGPADTGIDVTDTQTIAIAGTLAVTNHDAGQATNGFSYQNQTTVPLYRFKMIPTYESDIVGTLTLNLTGVRRISDENLQNISLYRDFNANGIVDGNDEVIGGTGALQTSDQNGTIVFLEPFLATTTQNYIVTGDTVSIKQNEYMTMSLLVSGAVMGSTSLATIVPTGSVLNVRHQRGGGASLSGGAGAIGGEAPAGASTTSGGGQGGGESIGGEPGFAAPTAQGSPFNEWISGANALVSDNVYATAPNRLSQSYSVFGFNVPPGNTVTGIEVKLEASEEVGSAPDGYIEVTLSWDGDNNVTPLKATSILTNTDKVYTLGGPADTWGRSWTPAELGNANFFVRVTSQPVSNTLQIDAIQVKPYHAATGGGGGGGGEI